MPSPIIDDDQAKEWATSLYDARRSRTSIAPFTDVNPNLGAADGYVIQQHLVRHLLADGERVIGYKLGLTSAPMQRLLQVDQPDFGPLFASTVYRDGAAVSLSDFIAPRVEAEIAVLLEDPLSGPDCTPAQVCQAAAGLIAAIEIVDSRIRDWRITLADTIADLASNGALALSGRVTPIDAVDPRLIGMVFTRNGEVVATGAGAAALGDPLAAVAWLANTLAQFGESLPAGSVILTGALHAMTPMAVGDTFRADFAHLGPVTLRIVD
jgi:2-keto-4-pentenoate hydratase